MTESQADDSEIGSGELLPYEPQTAVVRYREPERDLVDGWVQHATQVFKLADAVAHTEFVPRAMRGNPAAVAACILSGRELGVGPMTALRHVQVVEGSPSLSAEYKRARVLSKGHSLDVIELTTTRCVIRARRKGYEPREFTYTIDDARRANLVKPRGAWETRPRRMLFARVTSEACDFLFSDLVNGLPTAELLLEGAEYADLEEKTPGDDGTDRRVQRKTPAGTRARKAGSPQREAATAPEPPLPGEEEPDPAPVPGMGTPPSPGNESARPVTADAPAEANAPADERDTAAMVTKIQAMFSGEFGVKGRSDKLRIVSALAGREVTSSNDLTAHECHAVITAMEQAAAQGDRGQKAARLMGLVDAYEHKDDIPVEEPDGE